MRKLCNTSFGYAVLAMAGGVFYREFTKFNGVDGGTSLAFLHVHLFVLGMFFFLIAAILEKNFKLSQDKRFLLFYTVYNIGLLVTAGTFIWRGILQVFGNEISKAVDASISGIAGIGHILLAVGIVLFFFILRKQADKTE